MKELAKQLNAFHWRTGQPSLFSKDKNFLPGPTAPKLPPLEIKEQFKPKEKGPKRTSKKYLE